MDIIKQSILGISYSRKMSIKLLAATLILSCFSGNIFAHSGEDPNRKLAKHLDQINEYQKDFNSESDAIKRKKNLESQLGSLRSRLLVLRNELVSNTSTVKCLKKQSEIDYFKELERTLKSSQRLLKQMETHLEQDK